MKLPAFSHAAGDRKWDRFREFYNEVEVGQHYYNNPFIMFETGEFIITRSRFNPTARKHYGRLNISLHGSTDARWSTFLKNKNAKLKTPDGDEVLFSWLNDGRYQTILVDHDSGRVVRCSIDPDCDKRIPARLRHCANVYFACDKEPPIGGKPLILTEPAQLTGIDKKHVDYIVSACKAWNTLAEEAQILQGANTSRMLYDYAKGQFYDNPHYIPSEKMPVEKLLNATYTDLTWSEKKQIVTKGVKHRRKITADVVTHLNIVI